MSMLPWLALWLAISYVLMSIIEHVIHRWFMHRQTWVRWIYDAYETHHQLHHGTYFPPRQFIGCDDRAAKYISIDLGLVFMVVATSPVWAAILLLFGWEATATFVAFVSVHGVLWSVIHREMHKPKIAWLQRRWIYRYWRDYHEAHHRHPTRNFNILCVGCDWFMGTYIGGRS